MPRVQVIDGTGKVVFDSDNVDPSLYDEPNLAEGFYGDGGHWQVQTPEQLEREIEPTRPSIEHCVTCETKGIIKVLGEWEVCPTCHGVVRD